MCYPPPQSKVCLEGKDLHCTHVACAKNRQLISILSFPLLFLPLIPACKPSAVPIAEVMLYLWFICTPCVRTYTPAEGRHAQAWLFLFVIADCFAVVLFLPKLRSSIITFPRRCNKQGMATVVINYRHIYYQNFGVHKHLDSFFDGIASE